MLLIFFLKLYIFIFKQFIMGLIVNKMYETANPGIHSRLFGNWGCIIGLLPIGLACALIRIKVLNCTVTVHLNAFEILQ